MKAKDRIELETFAHTAYRKCDSCKRVQDIYFRANIKDAMSGAMLVGSLELCKNCGTNLGDIIGKEATTEAVVTDFKFEA